jgi:hypothetical protein
MGVRVVPLAVERAGLEARASALGVRFPFDGQALRLVMGRCVFYDDGCRLHEAYGADAKPRVCRQFPWVQRGGVIGVDPACAHHDAHRHSPVHGLLGVEASARDPLTSGDLAALGAELELDLDGVASAWARVPFAAWADQGTAGPLRRAGSEALATLVPPSTWPSWPQGADAVRRCWRLGLTDRPVELLIGAVVIAHGLAEAADRRRAFAVWVRSLRG